jgi:hypothetical protein
MEASHDILTLPLLYRFELLVAGHGFTALVNMVGSALLEATVDEHDAATQEEVCVDYSVTGVFPVGIVGVGADRGSAFHDFRDAWETLVQQLAAEASSYAVFERSCKEVLATNDSPLIAQWHEAVQQVRAHGYVDPHLRRIPVSAAFAPTLRLRNMAALALQVAEPSSSYSPTNFDELQAPCQGLAA